jgi:hypothetical protein
LRSNYAKKLRRTRRRTQTTDVQQEEKIKTAGRDASDPIRKTAGRDASDPIGKTAGRDASDPIGKTAGK